MRKYLSSVVVTIVFTGSAVCASAQKRAEVIVLATLHQYHATVKGYSFAGLAKVIEAAKPDILAVELTPAALEDRLEQKTKQEYQKSVFPLIDKHKYRAVPLEPSEPLYSELVGLLKDSNMEIESRSPQKAEAFRVYSDALYAHLFKEWDSPAAVNSRETDGQFQVKHSYQNALFGEKETRVWNTWNNHFLDQILKTARQNKGKRILVVVGVEHAYWLRLHLRTEGDIRFIEAGTIVTGHPRRR